MHRNGVELISILLTLSLVEIEICTACSRSFVVGDRGVGSVGVGAVSFVARAKESKVLYIKCHAIQQQNQQQLIS